MALRFSSFLMYVYLFLGATHQGRKQMYHMIWLTFLAAIKSVLPSIPMAKVWIRYGNFNSFAFFTSTDATRLESKPPENKLYLYYWLSYATKWHMLTNFVFRAFCWNHLMTISTYLWSSFFPPVLVIIIFHSLSTYGVCFIIISLDKSSYL